MHHSASLRHLTPFTVTLLSVPTKAALVVDLLWLLAGETAVVGDVGRLCPEQQHL